jgi:hypothetical protein
MNALELPSLSPIKIANHAAEPFVQTDGPARRPFHGPHRRGPPVSLNWIPTFAMWPYITKVTVTAIVVVAVAEIAKRSTVWRHCGVLPLTRARVIGLSDTETLSASPSLAQSVFWWYTIVEHLECCAAASCRLGIRGSQARRAATAIAYLRYVGLGESAFMELLRIRNRRHTRFRGRSSDLRINAGVRNRWSQKIRSQISILSVKGCDQGR